MKPISYIVFLIWFSYDVYAQKVVVNEYTAIDKKAIFIPDSLTKTTGNLSKYINDNFLTEKDKARAIFIWLASNIQYDVENMFAINFYETKENKITKTLNSRKGICENYAALFTEIAGGCGIKSFVVEGYTKQNGFADFIPHAWAAANIDAVWYMFDPTWGSGYINGGKFYKKINNEYFKTPPAVLLKSHIPFDYLFQLVNYPITNQEFYEGKIIQNKTKPFFNYVDSLELYKKQSPTERLVSTAYRIEKNGVKNAMIFDRLHNIKVELENDRISTANNLYNQAAANYNEAVRNLNAFIQYRNKQFNPLKTDIEIQQMVDMAVKNIEDANANLLLLKNIDANTATLINGLKVFIDEININIKEQQDWLQLYFSKNKSKRKAMFYERKITLFGRVIN